MIQQAIQTAKLVGRGGGTGAFTVVILSLPSMQYLQYLLLRGDSREGFGIWGRDIDSADVPLGSSLARLIDTESARTLLLLMHVGWEPILSVPDGYITSLLGKLICLPNNLIALGDTSFCTEISSMGRGGGVIWCVGGYKS